MRHPKLHRLNANSRDWHEAMGSAPDPKGFIARRGARTWDELSRICAEMVADWEKRPEAERLAYAFRNPEDRRDSHGRRVSQIRSGASVGSDPVLVRG